MLGIGSVVDGKYKILSEIGHGGMSVVYLAINERANKTWAIKEVRKDGTADFATVHQGLVAETEMLKKLDHPHLPSIIDVIDRDDSFLIVMDYIEGKSLESLLKHGGAQDPNKVIEWSKQLCDVLGYLHSRTPPIIYRDMKPANVMLKPDGNVMLIDFGTAREYKQASVEDTTCLGTRGYAAPEQFGGHGQTDGRTDIYCLGATIYHLITGHSPCEPPYEIKPLGYWNPALAGSGIEKLVAKCTRQNPAERYQNCAELMYALEHIHDEDDAIKRRRSVIWGGFWASIGVSLLGVVGMVGFSMAGNQAETQSYDHYLTQAKSVESDFSTAAIYYEDAIDLKPSNSDAYNELLNAIDSDMVFTSEESTALIRCVLNTDGGTKTNLDYLESSNKRAYDEFVYHLANDYYFFYEGSDNRSKAAQWYGKIQDSRYLSSQQIELAKGLYTIGSYYSSLGSDKNVFSVGDNTSTWLDFWNQMVELTDGDLTVKTGGARYAAALYKELVNQIYTNTSSFKAFGISQADMLAQIDKVESGLKTLTAENTAIQQQIDETQQRVAMAREQVNTVYAAVGGTGG